MLLSPGVGQTARCCCCCGNCCGEFVETFPYADGVPPAPWYGLFGADPGLIVSNALWGNQPPGVGSLTARNIFCPETSGDPPGGPVPPYVSPLRSASFTIRGGNNNEAVGAGLFSPAFSQICGVTWQGGTGSWHVISGAVDVDSTNANTEGVDVVMRWNTAGDYSVTLDGGAAIVGNSGPKVDPAVFVVFLERPYDAVDPTEGDWIDSITVGCNGL